MIFVSKQSETYRRTLSAAEIAAVLDYESGTTDKHILQSVSRLMNEARDKQFWLRCHCTGNSNTGPFITVFTTKTGTLAWRTWSSDTRPQHSKACIFHGRHIDQEKAAAWQRSAKKRPAGYFAVLPPSGRATVKDKTTGPRPKSAFRRSLPSTALLLYSLIEKAGLHSRPDPNIKSDIKQETKHLIDAAKSIDVAPGIRLSDVLSTYAGDWASGRTHGRIRDFASRFPKGHRPQGFVCFYSAHVDARGADLMQSGRIDCAAGVVRPMINGNPVKGPHLFFGAIGETQGQGYVCQRAYAVPIVSHSEFVPVDSDYERKAYQTLKFTHKRLSSAFPHYRFTLEKPLFETDTSDGPCIPDFIIKATAPNGITRQFLVEVMGFDRPSYLEGKQITHPRMRSIGPLVEMDAANFKTGLSAEGQKVTQFIADHLTAVR